MASAKILLTLKVEGLEELRRLAELMSQLQEKQIKVSIGAGSSQ